MSFSPPPPPGGSSFGSPGNLPGSGPVQQFPRRPKVWVPPLVAFGAFTAGYAIPWDFGNDPGAVIMRVVLPLVLAASFCLVAGFYTYRTLPGWRVWTWASFAIMLLNAIHTSVLSPLTSPMSVQVLLWFASLLLILSATLGQEDKSDLQNKPTSPLSGVN